MIEVEKVIILRQKDGISDVEITFTGRDGNAVVTNFSGYVRTSLTGSTSGNLSLLVQVLPQPGDPVQRIWPPEPDETDKTAELM